MTTSEIAKKLGISRGTVSRVLNNHPNVKPETRKRVLEALKELNYIPNETARSLVMQKEFHIAVIVFSQPAFFLGPGSERSQHCPERSGVPGRYCGLFCN